MPRKGQKMNKNNNLDGEEGPTKTVKKRRTSAAASAASRSNTPNNSSNNNSNNASNQEMIPQMPHCNYGDTVIASNPFDDAPSNPGKNQQTPPMSNCGPGSNPHTPQTPLSGMPPHTPGQQQKPMPMAAMTGKIYPPEQSMVFNPANPNAPPIYPCGICHKEVHDNDQAILCESGCNFWFHRSCTGITEFAYQLLTQEVYAEWVCDKCMKDKNIPWVKFKP